MKCFKSSFFEFVAAYLDAKFKPMRVIAPLKAPNA